MLTLAAARKARGLTQEALAIELREQHGLTIGPKSIAAYEAGLRNPRLSVARVIASHVGVPLDELQFATPRDGKGEACERQAS